MCSSRNYLDERPAEENTESNVKTDAVRPDEEHNKSNVKTEFPSGWGYTYIISSGNPGGRELFPNNPKTEILGEGRFHPFILPSLPGDFNLLEGSLFLADHHKENVGKEVVYFL